jgi:hypothetical protein
MTLFLQKVTDIKNLSAHGAAQLSTDIGRCCVGFRSLQCTSKQLY